MHVPFWLLTHVNSFLLYSKPNSNFGDTLLSSQLVNCNLVVIAIVFCFKQMKRLSKSSTLDQIHVCSRIKYKVNEKYSQVREKVRMKEKTKRVKYWGLQHSMSILNQLNSPFRIFLFSSKMENSTKTYNQRRKKTFLLLFSLVDIYYYILMLP